MRGKKGLPEEFLRRPNPQAKHGNPAYPAILSYRMDPVRRDCHGRNSKSPAARRNAIASHPLLEISRPG